MYYLWELSTFIFESNMKKRVWSPYKHHGNKMCATYKKNK